MTSQREASKFAIVPIYADLTGSEVKFPTAIMTGDMSAVMARIKDSKQMREDLRISNEAAQVRRAKAELAERERDLTRPVNLDPCIGTLGECRADGPCLALCGDRADALRDLPPQFAGLLLGHGQINAGPRSQACFCYPPCGRRGEPEKPSPDLLIRADIQIQPLGSFDLQPTRLDMHDILIGEQHRLTLP